MKCEQVQENLIDYLDRELSRDEIRQVESHVAECKFCARELADTERILNSVAEADDPGDAYFDGLCRRIMARIETEVKTPWYRRILGDFSTVQRWGMFAAPTALAATLALVFLFPALFGTGPVDKSGKPIPTIGNTVKMSPAVALPADPTNEVASMSDSEVEELHTALLAAMEDIVLEDAAAGTYGTAPAIPYNKTALPTGLDDLDPEALGTVIEMLTAESEDSI
jgi:anti-sigma factor RsiW